MPISFTVVAGPLAGRHFTFDRHDTFLIGRSPDAHFSLPADDYFSRMHCLIEVNPPRCRLTDLNSRNGTFVNGTRVQTSELRHGDEIRGGLTVIKVSVLDEQLKVTRDLGEVHDRPTEPPAHPAREGISTELVDRAAAPPGSSTPTLPTIPGYRLVGRLGEGGMGVVYRAVRHSDGSEVAVKTIRADVPADSPLVARFVREASILGKLRHPSIVAYLDSGAAEGMTYFAMELVAGTDAATLLAREGPLAIGRAVRLTLQVLLALDYAHGQGYVHRDVKPANLLVTNDGGVERVKLADFGLARAFQESALSGVTMTGTAAGTPHFMPPEQMTDFRTAKPAADQYATAATLYHLLTAAFPYAAHSAPELFRKVLTEEPMPLGQRRADVPAGLAVVVRRAMARRAEERYPDVRAMGQALTVFG